MKVRTTVDVRRIKFEVKPFTAANNPVEVALDDVFIKHICPNGRSVTLFFYSLR